MPAVRVRLLQRQGSQRWVEVSFHFFSLRVISGFDVRSAGTLLPHDNCIPPAPLGDGKGEPHAVKLASPRRCQRQPPRPFARPAMAWDLASVRTLAGVRPRASPLHDLIRVSIAVQGKGVGRCSLVSRTLRPGSWPRMHHSRPEGVCRRRIAVVPKSRAGAASQSSRIFRTRLLHARIMRQKSWAGIPPQAAFRSGL